MPSFVDGVVKPGLPAGRQILDLRQKPAANPIIPVPAYAAPAVAAPVALPTAPVRRRITNWSAVGVAVLGLAVLGSAVFAVARWQAHARHAVKSSAIQAAAAAAPKPIVPPAAYHDKALQKDLDAFAAAQPVPVALVAKDLKTGKYALVNPNQVFTSASMYKLFVANQILHRHDYQGLSLDAPTGYDAGGRSIKSCLQIMINVSNNECGRAFLAYLGWQKENPALASEGFTHTDLTNPYQKTSAGDVAKLLEQLYTTEFLKPASNNLLMQFLNQQQVNDRLPQGLPSGVDIAHKTGDLEGVVHDGGIVYGPKTDYIVVMLSGPWPTPANARPAFKDLSERLFAYFNPASE